MISKDELKPCPFHTCDTFGTCGCYDTLYMRDKDWNTRPIEDALNARIAELKGVIEILEDQQREAKNILIDKNLHIDSLYEEGYKLQQRIAELEAAQRWIPVSERLPEEDTDGNTLMVICRHSGEWVRAPFGAEFADEFVRHYSYWMYAPQPPEEQE